MSENATLKGNSIIISVEPAISQVKKFADAMQCCVLVKNIVDICVYRDYIRITKTYG